VKIYDTLQREIVDFIPRKEGEVSFYSCGPTVYSDPHLGHARQAMTGDIARRYFEWSGLRVHHVANITDIDDKIIKRALDEGTTEPEVAKHWEAVYNEADESKEDPLDFALWKAAKPDEPTWDSPWGPGRPGWHIECVAMSLGVLGDDFDLHGGGDDLTFPHHTNERAEAIAAGRPFARYWLHNAMLNIGGEKMSKSLNNFQTIQQLLDEDPLNARALRLLLLRTHYRKLIEIDADVMADAREGIKRLDAMARKATNAGIDATATERVGEAIEAFRAAMDHDFGTGDAMGTVFETVRRANGALDGGAEAELATALALTAIELANVLGLQVSLDSGADANEGDAEIDALVEARTEAKANKDFAKADQIRDELAAKGITIEDTANGPIWYR